MMSEDLSGILEFAKDVALEAGEITYRHFKGSFEAEVKADNSFVTIADREAEGLIRRRIAEIFPEDSILGEEAGERAGTSNRRWIIDPIDGTYSFVHRVPLYGVLIGVEVGGEPVAGVVNLPALGELVYAARGSGCYVNGARAQVSATSKLEEALLLCTDFGACDRSALVDLQRRVRARRTWGDVYGYVLVATGRADVMLDPTVKIWDCAPLLPILEEAGGTFTDWQGNRTIDGGNALATNGQLFEEVMQVLREPAVSEMKRRAMH